MLISHPPPLLSLTFLQLTVPTGPHWCHTCFCHAARTLALGPEHSSPDTCWDDPFTSVRSLTKSHFLYQALLDCPAQLSKLSLLPTLLGHFLSLSAHFIYAPSPYIFFATFMSFFSILWNLLFYWICYLLSYSFCHHLHSEHIPELKTPHDEMIFIVWL